jgi:hypothetical protein
VDGQIEREVDRQIEREVDGGIEREVDGGMVGEGRDRGGRNSTGERERGLERSRKRARDGRGRGFYDVFLWFNQ